MVASKSRQLQQYLQVLCSLAIFCATSPSVSAIRTTEFGTFKNSACEIFTVESSCVLGILSDYFSNVSNYQFAFFNRLANPNLVTLSIVWTQYVSTEVQYQNQRSVWSANRNRPVSSNASLIFVPNGSLVLNDDDGSEVWSTETENMGGVGLDFNSTSGELIIFDDRNHTVWSSFSHPTDTTVGGQPLTLGMTLVSGKSSTDNSEGAYSLVMEPAGLVLYASLPNPQPYYVWNYFAQSEEAMPVSSLQSTCHNPVTLELSGDGQLSLSNSSAIPGTNQNFTSNKTLCDLTPMFATVTTNSYPNTSFATFMVLGGRGNIEVYSYYAEDGLLLDYGFFNESQCDLPQICGEYGVCTGNGQCGCTADSLFLPTNSSLPALGCSFSGGPLVSSCTANAGVQISQLNGVDYYSNRFSAPTVSTSTMTECGNLCKTNCSCSASFYNSESGTCYTVSDQPLSSMISSNNTKMTALVKISTIPAKKKSNNLAVALGFGLAGLFVLLMVILGCVVFVSRRRAAKLARKSTEDEFLETLPGLPPRYSKKQLDGATMGFTRVLGSGGFGTVYDGTLKNGSKIAVKKLESSKGTKDFRAEMATLGSIHHINLVRLKGFCTEGVENMLVYEYMRNGSLDRWLFNNDSELTRLVPVTLDWKQRFNIALGTARGLAYLHDDCSERIIHLDIKPQNILLDEDFNPKVADFGLSKLVDRKMSTVVTTMRGTPGYLAPEWLLQAAITEKTDVYSYGIVLLELVTGRKCLDMSKQDPKERYAPSWVLQCLLGGDILSVVDSRLNIADQEEQVLRVIRIALECIQEEMIPRPSMALVVQMLEGLCLVPELQRESLSSKYRFLSSAGGSLHLSSTMSRFSVSSSLPQRSSSRSFRSCSRSDSYCRMCIEN